MLNEEQKGPAVSGAQQTSSGAGPEPADWGLPREAGVPAPEQHDLLSFFPHLTTFPLHQTALQAEGNGLEGSRGETDVANALNVLRIKMRKLGGFKNQHPMSRSQSSLNTCTVSL